MLLFLIGDPDQGGGGRGLLQGFGHNGSDVLAIETHNPR